MKYLALVMRPSSSTLDTKDSSDGRLARRFGDWRRITSGGFSGHVEEVYFEGIGWEIRREEHEVDDKSRIGEDTEAPADALNTLMTSLPSTKVCGLCSMRLRATFKGPFPAP